MLEHLNLSSDIVTGVLVGTLGLILTLMVRISRLPSSQQPLLGPVSPTGESAQDPAAADTRTSRPSSNSETCCCSAKSPASWETCNSMNPP